MSSCGSVSVKKMPESVSVSETHQLFNELSPLLKVDRPCIVLDFSEVRQLDSAGIELLLRCMEEAMKRNGDVKLAAVSPQAAVILQLTRVDRLFEIFEKTADAVESFHRFPVQAFRANQAPAFRS
jgi:anti-sigma B factor antagonist